MLFLTLTSLYLQKIDKILSLEAKSKLEGHLEYFGEELVWFSFFSKDIPDSTKLKMQKKLIGKPSIPWNPQNRSRTLSSTRIKVGRRLVPLEKCTVVDLINPRVREVAQFYSFNLLDTNFSDQKYDEMRANLENLTCVNDVAERGVALAKDFNQFGPRNEESHQNLLKTVQLQRKSLTGTTKKKLSRELKLNQ